MRLHGKTAIVTGAGSGFGAGIAQQFAAEGATVMVADINLDAAQAIAEPLAATAQHVDVASDSSVAHMIGAAQALWGRIDILVNNAGINKPVEHYDLDGLSAQDFMDIYNVNVIGAFQMIRAVAPAMQQQGAGVVVNVSSGSGENGYGSSVAYSASKGAINTLTKSLGRALAPTIRVNAVCPGMVITALWDKLQHTEEQRAAWLKTVISEIPLNKEPTPEIIARNILYLASDLSAHLTGQLITTDGGTSLGLYHPMFEQSV